MAAKIRKTKDVAPTSGAKIASRVKATVLKSVGQCPQCIGDLVWSMVSVGAKTRGRMMKVCGVNPDHRYA